MLMYRSCVSHAAHTKLVKATQS